jgi:pimeloyl-ACP methyl ester carboxylesterase
MGNLSLHDLAADVAMVVEHESKGPVVVVGHALGNLVGRMLATDRTDLVRGLVLAAAYAGKVPAGVNEPPISPEVEQAIEKSGDLSLPDDERLRYLAIAFFAPRHDPHVWLGGWYPEAMKAETTAWLMSAPRTRANITPTGILIFPRLKDLIFEFVRAAVTGDEEPIPAVGGNGTRGVLRLRHCRFHR